MKKLFDQIEQSYFERCGNHKLQKKYWNKIAAELPPGDLIQDPRPSLKLSQISGDPGISLMWIVQSTLIRSILFNILEDLKKTGSKSNISASFSKILKNCKLIGALAHSENKNDPVTISSDKNDKKILINGTKKYITGGINADFILLTTREFKDEKIKLLLYLQNNNTLKKSLENLDLNYLRTSCHAKLKMDNVSISRDSIIPISDKKLRKQLKVWSIIERSLILESLIGFLIFLYNKIVQIYDIKITDEEELKILLNMQKNIADKQINDALNNKVIEESYADMKQIFSILNNYTSFYKNEMDSMPEDLKSRFMDLGFLEIIKQF